MPPSFSAFSRAALPMLAAAASIPAPASAQVGAPATQVVPIQPLAGGVATPPARPATRASAARLVHVAARKLTTSGSTAVSVRLLALSVSVHVELRVGRTGRRVASGDLRRGEHRTLTGSANRGERLRLAVTRTGGRATSDDIAIGTVHRVTLRSTLASWYGPGLFGQRTACGQTLTRGLRGVANKSLACGTKITVRYRGRSTRAVVVDRGPFSGNREFDLTYATAQAIGFNSVGRIQVSV